jgi:hypothetical protein
METLVNMIPAIVAVLGIFISFMTVLLTRQQHAANRQESRGKRFTSAIEHLKDNALPIRMGALFELKKLGLESHEDQENIVRILGPFIREGMENEALLVDSKDPKGRKTPQQDIFIACEIAALFYGKSKVREKLDCLQATNLNLGGIQLQGADLMVANLQGADLVEANLQGAFLWRANLQGADLVAAKLQGADLGQANLQGANLGLANLQGADLRGANLQGANLGLANLRGAYLSYANLQGADLCGANLQGANLVEAKLQGADLRNAENLTVKQLLGAFLDDKTLLDPQLRKEYDSRKAERVRNGQE